MVGFGDEDENGTPVDDPTTTIDVSVEDATDDEDDNVLRGFDDEEPAVSDIMGDHKPHDRVSLRIDDGDVIAAPGKPGTHALITGNLYLIIGLSRCHATRLAYVRGWTVGRGRHGRQPASTDRLRAGIDSSGGGGGVAYKDGQMGGRYKQGLADLADGRAGRWTAQIEPKSHVFDRVPSHLQTVNRLSTLVCILSGSRNAMYCWLPPV